jgi:hypothetical protein
MLIAGRTLPGTTRPVEYRMIVAECMSEFLRSTPGDSKYSGDSKCYALRCNADGMPNPDEVSAAAEHTTMVQIAPRPGQVWTREPSLADRSTSESPELQPVIERLEPLIRWVSLWAAYGPRHGRTASRSDHHHGSQDRHRTSSWIIETIHHGKNDAGQRVASLAGASVFDIMRVPRGAALLMWKQWQTLMSRRSGDSPI